MRRLAVAVAFVGALVLSACQLVLTPVGVGGSSSACPVGNWAVSAQDVNAMVTRLGSTLASNLAVTLDPVGVTAAINADGTWSVTAHQTGSFTGTLGGQAVSGTGVLDALAKGTYTKTATTITFTTKTLTGTSGGSATLKVSGTLGGTAFSNVVFSLPSANSDDDQTEVEDVVGLTGTAGYTCGSTGTLALTFSRSHIDIKLKH